MIDPTQHLLTAFSEFLAAGFNSPAAMRGVLGFWLGTPESANRTELPHSDDTRSRALRSSAAWGIEHPQTPNPYADVVAFLEHGGDLGRWENNILNVYLPGGDWVGIPLTTFTGAAANNSFKPKPLRGSA